MAARAPASTATSVDARASAPEPEPPHAARARRGARPGRPPASRRRPRPGRPPAPLNGRPGVAPLALAAPFTPFVPTGPTAETWAISRGSLRGGLCRRVRSRRGGDRSPVGRRAGPTGCSMKTTPANGDSSAWLASSIAPPTLPWALSRAFCWAAVGAPVSSELSKATCCLEAALMSSLANITNEITISAQIATETMRNPTLSTWLAYGRLWRQSITCPAARARCSFRSFADTHW